jgi:enamine deaminase RidA (YjgF/YER057c/UK114 family)
MPRQLVATGTPWEPLVGCSRAVRVGNQIHVSGTTATNAATRVVGTNDPCLQTARTPRDFASALERAGASNADVVVDG